MIRSEAAGGQHAVDMRMMLQSLVPGMDHAEEANLGSKVPGIAGDLEQSCSTGMKQQVIDQTLVLQCQRGLSRGRVSTDRDVHPARRCGNASWPATLFRVGR